VELHAEMMFWRREVWSPQAASYLKVPLFGMTVEILATRGTWSEVSRVREKREEEGKRTFQGVLIKTRSSRMSVGVVLLLDQVY
jgi:hypothetical protein